MSDSFLSLLTIAVPVGLIVGVIVGRVYGMQRRRIDYLRDEVRSLGGEDQWNVRCSHCGDRMRDAASVRLSTRIQEGSGWSERTDGVFHTDRLACAEAADRLRGDQ